MRDLLVRYPMDHDDKDRTPVYAVDVTPWPRCDAEASPERGYYYHPDTRRVSPSSPAGHTTLKIHARIITSKHVEDEVVVRWKRAAELPRQDRFSYWLSPVP